MFRLTTPTHKFVFDSDPSVYQSILITYAQRGEIILEKQKSDLSFEEDNTVSVKLTQEETAKFNPQCNALIQIRVLCNDGTALASDYMRATVKDVLNEEVLS